MAYFFRAFTSDIEPDGYKDPIGGAFHEWRKSQRRTKDGIIGPIPKEFCPTEMTIKAREKSRLEDVYYLQAGILVSERFRALVEDLEPGIHFFHPVPLRRTKCDIVDPYYFFFPGQRVDAVLPTRSKPTFEEIEGLVKSADPYGAYYLGLEDDSDSEPRLSFQGGSHAEQPSDQRQAHLAAGRSRFWHLRLR